MTGERTLKPTNVSNGFRRSLIENTQKQKLNDYDGNVNKLFR